jgi:hypothetical protein
LHAKPSKDLVVGYGSRVERDASAVDRPASDEWKSVESEESEESEEEAGDGDRTGDEVLQANGDAS